MIGSVAGPTLASLFAPEGQEIQSFRGHGSIDPVNMLHNVNTLLGRIGNVVTDRAAQPISLGRGAIVQQPTAFTGGGLPFPIGLSGVDPALSDPSILTLPGIEGFAGVFDNLVSSQNPDDTGYVDLAGYHAPPGMTGGDRRAVPRNGTMPPSSPGGPGPGGDPGEKQHPSPAFTGTGPRRPGVVRRTGTGLTAAHVINDGPSMAIGAGNDDLDQAYGSAQLLLEALSSGDQDAINDLLAGGFVGPAPSPRFAIRA